MVRWLLVVPFARDGRCLLARDPDGAVRLPGGPLAPGEHELDAARRLPLAAGLKVARYHPFALGGDRRLAWAQVEPVAGATGPGPLALAAGAAAARLAAAGRRRDAAAVRAAVASRRADTEADWYADNLRFLEHHYLAATTAEGGSGFGRDAAAWRSCREAVVDGLDRDGTFLDVGCANGLLMESVAAWAAERGLAIEPYGVDLSARLVELARRRRPAFAGRLWVGNAVTWVPPGGRRFDFVHVLPDLVPPARLGDLLAHQLARVVVPGGRLLVSGYGSSSAPAPPPVAAVLRRLGHRVAGASGPRDPAARTAAATAWVDAPPARP